MFVDGKQGMLSLEEAIFHLVNHGTYHRGAIGHALGRADSTGPPIPTRCLSMGRSLNVEKPEAYSSFDTDPQPGAP